MKGNIEERVIEVARYIVKNKSTVRETAKRFKISKSTVHIVVKKCNHIYNPKMFLQSAFFKITIERAGRRVILNQPLVTF